MALASLLTVSIGACADYDQEERPATDVSAVDYGVYDDDIDRFRGDYVREGEMFADDNLEYDVNDGIVNVTGEVDTQEELAALQTRIRRVPGVRDLNVTGVRVGGTS